MRHFFNIDYRHYTRRLLDMILPPRCPMTGELVDMNGTVSPRYWRQLQFIHSPICSCCGAPHAAALDHDMICGQCLKKPPIYHKARAVFRYDEVSAPMILKFKHADGTQLAPLFARWMRQSGAELLAESDLIIPVPMHRWRLIRRRYNQAALLAQLLAQYSKIPYEAFALTRIRHTPPQGTKTTEQRFKNTENAFDVPLNERALISGKNILLVDDVYTSGATAQHCAETLLKHGAASVNVLTLARTGYAQ